MELVNIIDIDNSHFIGYMSKDRLFWGFHVNTLKNILENTKTNPYNLQDFPREFLETFKNLNVIESKQVQVKLPLNIQLQQRCVEVFQLIDNLDNYTKCEWFLRLRLRSLKYLYKYFEDMWVYRLQLSNEDKKKYINEENGVNPFIVPIVEIFKWTNHYKIANLILDIFKRFVTEGQTKSDRNTASKWILSCLTLVSQDASLALPWLYQAAYF